MKLNLIHLTRDKKALYAGTLGNILIPEVRMDGNVILRKFRTVERRWANNQQRVSCIPDGMYKLVQRKAGKRFYERYKGMWGHQWVPEVSGVPNRSAILIHTANAEHDVIGCIGVGYPDRRTGPHEPWVRDSVEAYKKIYDLLDKLWKVEKELYINISTANGEKCAV